MNLANRRMQEKIEFGDAMDVSDFPMVDGDYVITHNFVGNENLDYCVASSEAWIWSIGKHRVTGVILASTSTKYYQHPEYECVWLR